MASSIQRTIAGPAARATQVCVTLCMRCVCFLVGRGDRVGHDNVSENEFRTRTHGYHSAGRNYPEALGDGAGDMEFEGTRGRILAAVLLSLTATGNGFPPAQAESGAMLTGGDNTQPIGHYEFCKGNPAECAIRSQKGCAGANVGRIPQADRGGQPRRQRID